jgi:hypothetical protein
MIDLGVSLTINAGALLTVNPGTLESDVNNGGREPSVVGVSNFLTPKAFG